jgi:hypothetical protein
MEIPKSLGEVWEWREQAAKGTEGLPPDAERRVIHDVSEEYRKRLGLKIYRPYHKEESLRK